MHARFYAPDLFSGCHLVELPADEAEHLSRVLRLRVGAEVRLFDGRGHEFDGRVEVVERSRVVVAAGRELPDAGAEPRVGVVLAQALLKGDAMDQVVRDAVMLGVSEIVPLETVRCEMPARRVKSTGRVARWQRIAVASVKQCGRAVVPKVCEPRRLDECLREFQGMPGYMLAEPALAAPRSAPPSSLPAPARALLDRRPGRRLDDGRSHGRRGRRLPAAHARPAHHPGRRRGGRRAHGVAVLLGRVRRRPHMNRTADDWIRLLNLAPHPEGGCFAETYRSADTLPADVFGGRYAGPRACATAIYFLLRGTEFSALHRLRSDEMWHYHAGGGGRIVTIGPDGMLGSWGIGPDPERGQELQVMVPAGTWFGATVDDPASYLLVGCTVSPGFAYEDFELATREALTAAYPSHRAIIERLTRA